jgi:hypothetical protein
MRSTSMFRRAHAIAETTIATFIVAAFTVHAAVAQNTDAPAFEVELLGNPIVQVYGNRAGEKREVWALQAFEGRLYVAHGTSDTRLENRVIYFDPQRGEFDVERDADGRVVRMDAEVIRWARVIDDVLYFGNYDSISDRTKHYRRINGEWIATDTGRGQHARDFLEFDGRLFTFAGYGGSTRPHVMISSDGGDSWRSIRQPELPEAMTAGWTFGVFAGELFSFNGGNHVLRYVPDEERFEPRFSRSSQWLAGAQDDGLAFLVTQAIEFNNRLLVVQGGSAWSVSSMAEAVDPAGNPRIELPEGVQARMFATSLDRVFLLANRSRREADAWHYEHVVLQSADGMIFEKLLSFEDGGSTDHASAIGVLEADVYIGRHGGDVFRIRGAAGGASAKGGQR